MASGYEALAKVRRKRASSARWDKIYEDIGSSFTAAAVYGKGKAESADTAWSEYEAGYKELGGTEPIERPEFGKKGWLKSKFKGPEGEVRIGDMMYDRGKIQKAGSFLGSDAAAVLDEKTRAKYLQRTVPGRDLTAEEVYGVRKSLRPKMPFTGGEYDVDEEFGEIDTAKDPTSRAAQYPQGPSLWSKATSAVKEGGVPLAGAVAGTALTAFNPGAVGAGMTLWGPMVGKLSEQYTDKQLQPYMESPESNAWDTQIKNNKNRRPYDLRPPEQY